MIQRPAPCAIGREILLYFRLEYVLAPSCLLLREFYCNQCKVLTIQHLTYSIKVKNCVVRGGCAQVSIMVAHTTTYILTLYEIPSENLYCRKRKRLKVHLLKESIQLSVTCNTNPLMLCQDGLINLEFLNSL